MREEELRRLVDRYYNGDSTEEEERALKEFFKTNNVPQGYEAEKEIFRYYDDSEVIPEPSVDFEARLMAGIDASMIVAVSRKKNRYLVTALSAAAGLLILAGSYFFFVNRIERADTFTDPKLAYVETIRILRDVSSRLNRGTQILEPVGKMNEISRKSFSSINRPARIVGKNLKNLDYLKNVGKSHDGPVVKNVNK